MLNIFLVTVIDSSIQEYIHLDLLRYIKITALIEFNQTPIKVCQSLFYISIVFYLFCHQVVVLNYDTEECKVFNTLIVI